ncbi:MAG TPA: hypothetical protein VML55_09875, partial [Planctomycetaceae bacterium]|nr:hypothetical protein [Planctomycetaceae bacterium]
MSWTPPQDRTPRIVAPQVLSNGNGLPAPGEPARGPMPEPPAPSGTIDAKGLWNAFRRRWFLAVSLGLVAGSGGAVAAWFLMPAPYTSTSEVRVLPYDPIFKFRTDIQQPDPRTFKETQKKLIKSPFVLNAALREPQIARLRMVREQPAPLEWLEEELQVADAGTEFIRISISGSSSTEVATLVNAVTDAYIRDVAMLEEQKLRQRLTELNKFVDEKEDALERRQLQFQTFVEKTNAASSQDLSALQQFKLQIQATRVAELIQTQSKLNFAQAKLAALVAGEGGRNVDVPDDLLTHEIEQEKEFLDA